METRGTRPGYSGTAIAAIVFAAMIAALVYRYFPSDERSIRRHLSNLAEALSIPTTDTEVERITRFAVLREYFIPDVRIRLDGEEIVSREALVGLLAQVKPPPGGAAVEFVEVTVALAEGRATASVGLTGKLSMHNPSTGESEVDERQIDLVMQKLNGDWVIASAETRDAR